MTENNVAGGKTLTWTVVWSNGNPEENESRSKTSEKNPDRGVDYEMVFESVGEGYYPIQVSYAASNKMDNTMEWTVYGRNAKGQDDRYLVETRTKVNPNTEGETLALPDNSNPPTRTDIPVIYVYQDMSFEIVMMGGSGALSGDGFKLAESVSGVTMVDGRVIVDADVFSGRQTFTVTYNGKPVQSFTLQKEPGRTSKSPTTNHSGGNFPAAVPLSERMKP